jgi:hypothetical protein
MISRRRSWFWLAAIAMAGACGCESATFGGSAPSGDRAGVSRPSPGPGGSSSGSGGSSASGPTAGGSAAGGAGGGSGEPPVLPQPGRLTAGTWDDNLNFEFFQKYVSRFAGLEQPGTPQLARTDRLVVQVNGQDGTPMSGVEVWLDPPSGGTPTARSVTGAEGRAVLLPGAGARAGSMRLNARLDGASTAMEVPAGAEAITVPLAQPGRTIGAIDIAFVVDTTGSMGDEISYLQSELGAIAARLASDFPQLAKRWALVAYKDQGDEYVVRPTNFTANLADFQRTLGGISAGGGGDFPEAPDQALAASQQLSWGAGATARVLFWVADAPHHTGREAAFTSAVLGLVSQGVHIYPVASSGIDELAEFSMRSAAQVTGGRYLFLTDDSGVGGAHKEPTIPCYYVTSLQAAMSRMLKIEVLGTYLQPTMAEVIRTGGNPRDQRCQLSDSEVVAIY